VQENPQSEVTQLRKMQSLAREREVYGGFSPAERAEYEARAKRIKELDAPTVLDDVMQAGRSLKFGPFLL